MSSDKYQKALSLGVHPILAKQNTMEGVYQLHSQFRVRHPAHHAVDSKHLVTVKVNPTTAVTPSSFLNRSRTDFRIPRHSVSYLKNLHLRINITNSTGAAVGLAHAAAWIDKIEVFHASNLLFSIDSLQLYLSMSSFLSRNEWESISSFVASSDAYAVTGESIADGASKTFFIPIISSAFNNANLCLSGLHDDLVVRVHTNPSTLILTSGSHPTVNSAELIIRGFSEEPAIQQIRQITYNDKVPLCIPYYHWQYNKETITLAASTSYNTVLQSIKGNVIALFFMIRASALTSSNQFVASGLGVGSLELEDASGHPMTGAFRMSADDFKFLSCTDLDFPNQFYENANVYVIAFSSNPVGDFATGQITGYENFTGTERINFQTPSGFAGGTYEVVVQALTPAHLVIENRNIESRR